MKVENTVFLNVNMRHYEDPNNLRRIIKPTNLLNFQWVPQTMGECVWMFFEFKNEIDKNEFLKYISTVSFNSAFDGKLKYVDELLGTFLDQELLDYWCTGKIYNP